MSDIGRVVGDWRVERIRKGDMRDARRESGVHRGGYLPLEKTKEGGRGGRQGEGREGD